MLTFGDPFEALLAIQSALEARRSSGWMGAGTAGAGSFPPINIFQQGEDFVAIVELPGMDKDELQVEAHDGTIRISGKKQIAYPEGTSVHRRERLSGSFDRTISLPVEIDAESIRAEYRDGLLALFIPRAESAKPRSIKIN
jgi:HSP20 family protein